MEPIDSKLYHDEQPIFLSPPKVIRTIINPAFQQTEKTRISALIKLTNDKALVSSCRQPSGVPSSS